MHRVQTIYTVHILYVRTNAGTPTIVVPIYNYTTIMAVSDYFNSYMAVSDYKYFNIAI